MAAGERSIPMLASLRAPRPVGVASGSGATTPHPTVEELREALAHPDPQLRFDVAWALFNNGAPAEQALIGGLIAGLDTKYSRGLAANAIGRIGRPARAAVPRLAALLADEDALCRADAARALVTMRQYAQEAVPALARLLGGRDEQCRYLAADALASIGPGASAAVPALSAAINDPDEMCRRSAVQALGSIGPGAVAAVPALMTLLRDPENACYEDAAAALGKIGPAAVAAVPALRALAGDPDSLLSLETEDALKLIEGNRKLAKPGRS